MDIAWCSKCHEDVSLAHAVAELPCPSCGAKTYFMIVESADKEALLGESERMMRLGRWDDAGDALAECRKRGLISAADYNLSSANLEWRRRCAASAIALASGSGVPLAEFRAALIEEFDAFVVDWLLQECRLIRLVPAGCGYIVEVA